MEFFSTTAQIIPVLLLALAIEVRFFEAPQVPRLGQLTLLDLLNLLYGAQVLGMMLWAEWEAIDPLISGNFSGGNPSIVVAGVVVGFVGMVVAALIPSLARPSAADGSGGQRQ